MLETNSIPVGPLQANCHILRDGQSGNLLVIDPGDEPEQILAFIERLGGKVEAIWNTHAHIDHINANGPVSEATGAPISIHRAGAPCLESPELSGASFTGLTLRPSKADHLWEDGQEIEALGRRWKIHHSPGHSPACCAIVCDEEDLVIAGDLLFQGSIGRTDLPGSSPEEMGRSLRRLHDEWGQDGHRVLTGHGPATTIGQEKQSNPFLLYLRENNWVLPG